MTVSTEVETDIRRLFFAEHWKIGTIAAQLHVHPDVVRRVAGLTSIKRVLPSLAAPLLLEPFVPIVQETLQRYPSLRATRLFDMLRARGYEGSLRTLRRRVRALRPTRRVEAFTHIETLPGEQAQVDWAHVGTLHVPGGQRPLWAFVMVLGYSRALWAELLFEQTVPSLRRSLIRASRAFGGCTRQWLFDNPKTIVLERSGQDVRFHPALLEVCGTMNVQPRLCAVRKPQQKGKVERAIRFLKERFFAARPIASIDDGNQQLSEWITTVANERAHPTQRGHTVRECLEQEQQRLLRLPSPLPSEEHVQPIAVDLRAFVRFDNNSYSVPASHAGSTKTIAFDDRVVRVMDRDVVIAEHPRCWGRDQRVERREHHASVLQSKSGAHSAKGRERLLRELPGIEALLSRWLDDGLNVGTMVKRTTVLLDAYGSAVVRAALEQMRQRDTHDPGALAQWCEQQRAPRRAQGATRVELGAHVKERDVIPHALEGYDEKR
jgi:transposase